LRRAGISSFGATGSNAHIILEEYTAENEESTQLETSQPVLIPISAKTSEGLQIYITKILNYLKAEKERIDLTSLAFTLQTGRVPLEERLGLIASSLEDLEMALAEVIDGKENIDKLYRGQVTHNKNSISVFTEDEDMQNTIDAWFAKKKYSKLIELWVKGYELDWNRLYLEEVKPNRISLPTYPFKKKRYWISNNQSKVIPLKLKPEQSMDNQLQLENTNLEKIEINTNHEDSLMELQYLVPVWNPIIPEQLNRVSISSKAKTLLLDSNQIELKWVQESYPNTKLLEFSQQTTIELIQEKLRDCSFDHLFWVAPDVSNDLDKKNTILKQDKGVLQVFRIIKALLNLGYGTKKIEWTIITRKTQLVKKQDIISPDHAGVFGLVGSLAKEFPYWKLRLLDIESFESVSANECFSLAEDSNGNGFAYRNKEWFQQELAVVKSINQANSQYQKEGVYVVIGGAGGIGEVWSRFMIKHYNAHIIWIGRRKKNDSIQKKIESLGIHGKEPLYISADATNLSSLKQAFKKIKIKYPKIHGVVHSVIVLKDQSLDKMEEVTFKAGLSAKVDVSVNMDLVFGKLDLDFMLFFSSVQSFAKGPGQSNYSAGCTFKDSFALMLNQKYSYPVKIINWGYWGSIGIVANDFYKKKMTQIGLGSIEPQEGMDSLQAFVGSKINQLGLIKTTKNEVIHSLSSQEEITYYTGESSSILHEVIDSLPEHEFLEPDSSPEKKQHTQEMESLLTEILIASLFSLGLFMKKKTKIRDLSLEAEPAHFYEDWLSVSVKYLQKQNYINEELAITKEMKDLSDLWNEWEEKRSGWISNSSLQHFIILLERCLKALPDILSGKKIATEVLFPDGSLNLVEGIYKDNPVFDYNNDLLSSILVESISKELQIDKNRKIRILEIGAGTGGTTEKVLHALQKFSGSIEEYCYTDLSKVFLIHAEKNYQPDFSALRTSIFDVSQPLAKQLIAKDHYDFVIAANVLHATPNIRETLRNTKAILKNQGVLLLNEICDWSLFAHLTFGLLEGWWLYEDTTLRLDGSPGLYPKNWVEVLEEEGYESVFFPAKHKSGQQVITASSNGIVRQKIKKDSTKITSSEVVSSNKEILPIKENKKQILEIAHKGENDLEKNKKLFSDSCGILMLNALQVMGFLKEIDQKISIQTIYGKICIDSELKKLLLNTMLNVLKKSELINIKEDLISLSEKGGEKETRNKQQNIESRIGLFKRALPELSSHFSLLQYCIENLPDIFGNLITIEELFKSDKANNWIHDTLSYSKDIDQSDEQILQIISQNLTPFMEKEKITIVDLGCVENSIGQTVLFYLDLMDQKYEYYYVEGSALYKKIIKSAQLNRNTLNSVDFFPLKNEDDLLKVISSKRKADIVIIQSDLLDNQKLENKLTFAKEILDPKGLILASDQMSIMSDMYILIFGLLENRLLHESKPGSYDKTCSWSSVFNKTGYHVDSIFGEWLVSACLEFEEETYATSLVFLSKVFSTVLNIAQDELDINTNLHEYGLDSILISQVYIDLKEKYRDVLSPDDLLEKTTIKMLADFIEEKRKELPTTSSSNEQRKNNLIEIPKPIELTEKFAVGIMREDNSMQTDNIKVSSGREYEVLTCGEGEPLMFLTGLAFNWKMWKNQIPALRKDYRLIFPHLPGHSASFAENGNFDFENLIDDLIDILNHYNIESSHLLGWCMGGNIAQLFALKYPERLKTLSLVATTPTELRLRGLMKKDMVEYSANPFDMYILEFRNSLKDSPFQDSLSELYLEYLKDCYCSIDNVYIMSYIENLFRFDSTEWLKKIDIPTLVMAGKWDVGFPLSQVKLIHQSIANSKYIEFNQSGHIPFLTQHDRFNNELHNFLLSSACLKTQNPIENLRIKQHKS
ncbi:MAG: alpha/beta fold hydrolase, partial [Desulfobacterales bacterium]|nr:alpha/beta fold hydrolase [Desulfobacterales bacterium]